jgi:tRNA G10  N-methylase Trm11
MNGFGALKLVESPAFYSRDLEMPDDNSGNELSHSLHYSVRLPESLSPCLASYFISKFSRKGQVILDPFCGSGNVALESILLGRVSKASDISTLALEISRAKLNPADITEVTLKMQTINLKRPVDLLNFRQVFSAFYDIDTYREVLNLREYLKDKKDKASAFINLLAMSILHGNNRGYLSCYSHPEISLSPAEQQKINFQRAQSPDYRPLHPRILRKAAFVLREGIPSVMQSNMQFNSCLRSDVRDLSYLTGSSIDLVITRPPALKLVPKGNPEKMYDQQWLRNWFIGEIDDSTYSEKINYDIDHWKDFLNESLLEIARVLKPGGRAVLEFSEVSDGNECINPDDLVVDMVNENLSRFWDAEGVYIQKLKSVKGRHEQTSEPLYSNKNSRSLVLRRR